MGLLVFYTDIIYIILSWIQLKISQGWYYTLASHIHKETRFMSYKYIMNHSNFKFTISSFLIFLAYIFSKSISLKYHCTFFFYKVTDLSIWESSYPSNKIFYRYHLLVTLTYREPPITSYQPLGFSISIHSYTLAKKNWSNCLK
jgi:hypothetical protein